MFWQVGGRTSVGWQAGWRRLGSWQEGVLKVLRYWMGAGEQEGSVELWRDDVESRRNERHFDGGQVSGRRGCGSQGAIGTGITRLESQREAGSDEPAVGDVLRRSVCEAAREGGACFTGAGAWAGCPQQGTPRSRGAP